MASRLFSQFRYSLEKDVVDLYAKVTFSGAGNPTSYSGKGIKSVARSAQGVFVFTLDDKYQKVLAADATFVLAAGSFPAAPQMQITDDQSAGSTHAVTVQFANPAGTVATDPANAEVGLFHLQFSNSTAK